MSVLNTSGRREIMRVMKLTSEAIIPTRGSSLAAGYDLSSAYDYVIPAGGKGLVKTDLVIAIPHGTYARVAPRSGLALKKFIDTGAGVIGKLFIYISVSRNS
jgi:deoxyuridine 5'-triphosphate nucleotidohydrolase